jgi:uncharacterized protein (DUF983 family)
MNISRGQIIARGLSNRCPNCGAHSLFPPRSLRINSRCPSCGVGLDRGEGFYLGPWVLNYSLVVFGVVLPAIILGVIEVIAWPVALVAIVAGCVGLPLLLYRASWSWWLAVYFFFLPQRLPANGGARDATAED